VALISKRARSARHLDAVIFESAAETIEFGACWNLPPHHGEPGIAAAVYDQPLLAIVHAKGARPAAAVDLLHPKQPRRHLAPLIQLRGLDPDITERGDFHATSS
jgi:hypothetical protein